MDGMLPVSYSENSTITPCEVIETRAPILFLRKELRPDSGGPGRRRGGVGQVIAFRHVGSDPIIFNLTPDRVTTPPVGLDRGGAGEVYINGEAVLQFPPITLRPGDTVELHLPGGGGFGPVEEREVARVLADLRMGYITPRGAFKDYGLAPTALPGGGQPRAGAPGGGA